MRKLLQTGVDEPVFVSKPRELEDAILQGRHHIVITEHLDLTSMPLRSTTICPDGCESPLPEIRETMSIRGNCKTPPDNLDIAVLEHTPGAAELLPIRPRQCLIMTHEDVLPVLSARIWLDNLYLRVVHHNTFRDRDFHYITLSLFPLLKRSQAGQGEYYITRSTFQGDGLGPAVGVWADEDTYIESVTTAPYNADCTFANLGGDGADSTGRADFSGNVNAFNASVAIVNSTFFDPMRLRLVSYVRAWGGGSVLLSGCSFALPPDIGHPLFYARGNATVYTADADAPVVVRSNDDGATDAARPFDDLPADLADRGFLRRNDPWFVNVVEV